MKNISLQNILTNLIGRVNPSEYHPSELQNKKKVGTTIRLEPDVRAFVEKQSENLRISIQDFIAMTMRAVMVSTATPQRGELELQIDRFFEVFRVHGIPTCDIPSFIKDDRIRKSDLLSRRDLLNLIDDSVIETLTNLFYVNPLWLKGVSNDVIDRIATEKWYKNLGSIFRFIYEASEQGKTVSFVVITREGEFNSENLDQYEDKYIMPYLEIESRPHKVSYKSYKLLEMGHLGYSVLRHEFKSLLSLLDKMCISIKGAQLSKELFEQVRTGQQLFVEHAEESLRWDYNFRSYVDEDPRFNVDMKDFEASKIVYERGLYKNCETVFKNRYKYKDYDTAWEEEIYKKEKRA